MLYSRQKLYIENMLSHRCKRIFEAVSEELGLECIVCELGEVDVYGRMTAEQRHVLKTTLTKHGLKLLDEEKTRLMERILDLIKDKFNQTEQGHKINFSDYMIENLDFDYHYIANLFSRIKGITLENYVILYKIEKVKEFLLYENLNLTEISYRLEYSSVGHLSTQFKKVTGITPSMFKLLASKRPNSNLLTSPQFSKSKRLNC